MNTPDRTPLTPEQLNANAQRLHIDRIEAAPTTQAA